MHIFLFYTPVSIHQLHFGINAYQKFWFCGLMKVIVLRLYLFIYVFIMVKNNLMLNCHNL